MKKRRAYQLRTFICPDCGETQKATKVKGRTGKGHVKNLYCPRCKGERHFIQTDAEIVRA
jgi:uncharacterized protein YlaI